MRLCIQSSDGFWYYGFEQGMLPEEVTHRWGPFDAERVGRFDAAQVFDPRFHGERTRANELLARLNADMEGQLDQHGRPKFCHLAYPPMPQ